MKLHLRTKLKAAWSEITFKDQFVYGRSIMYLTKSVTISAAELLNNMEIYLTDKIRFMKRTKHLYKHSKKHDGKQL